jgi:hypothetical protein
VAQLRHALLVRLARPHRRKPSGQPAYSNPAAEAHARAADVQRRYEAVGWEELRKRDKTVDLAPGLTDAELAAEARAAWLEEQERKIEEEDELPPRSTYDW